MSGEQRQRIPDKEKTERRGGVGVRFSSAVTAGMIAVASCTAGAEGSLPERIACRRAEQGGRGEERQEKKVSPGEAQTWDCGAGGGRRGRGMGGREPLGLGLFLLGFRFESDGGKRSRRGKKTGKGQARPGSGCRVKKKLPVSETQRAFCFIAGAQGETRTPTTFVTTTSR